MRVWDYHAQTCVAVYQAANPVKCVALHPWGTDVIISFHESAFTYVVGGNELIKGQRLAESASGDSLHRPVMEIRVACTFIGSRFGAQLRKVSGALRHHRFLSASDTEKTCT